MNNVMYYCAA